MLKAFSKSLPCLGWGVTALASWLSVAHHAQKVSHQRLSINVIFRFNCMQCIVMHLSTAYRHRVPIQKTCSTNQQIPFSKLWYQLSVQLVSTITSKPETKSGTRTTQHDTTTSTPYLASTAAMWDWTTFLRSRTCQAVKLGKSHRCELENRITIQSIPILYLQNLSDEYGNMCTPCVASESIYSCKIQNKYPNHNIVSDTSSLPRIPITYSRNILPSDPDLDLNFKYFSTAKTHTHTYTNHDPIPGTRQTYFNAYTWLTNYIYIINL